MGRFVIASYIPKPGKAEQLLAVVRKHMPVLRGEGLVTDRPSHVMRAADGTIVEAFEWVSPEAIDRAHGNSVVQALWEEFRAVCDYRSLASLVECGQTFAEFDAVEL
jgi:hypothetical protein